MTIQNIYICITEMCPYMLNRNGSAFISKKERGKGVGGRLAAVVAQRPGQGDLIPRDPDVKLSTSTLWSRDALGCHWIRRLLPHNYTVSQKCSLQRKVARHCRHMASVQKQFNSSPGGQLLDFSTAKLIYEQNISAFNCCGMACQVVKCTCIECYSYWGVCRKAILQICTVFWAAASWTSLWKNQLIFLPRLRARPHCTKTSWTVERILQMIAKCNQRREFNCKCIGVIW